MDNHQIDQWAREEIKDREITPRPMVWEKLEAELNKENSASPKPRWKVIFWISSLFLAGLIWFATRSLPVQTETITHTRQEQNTSVEMNDQKPNNTLQAEILQEEAFRQEVRDVIPNTPGTSVVPHAEKSKNKFINKPSGSLTPAGLETRPVQPTQENIKPQAVNPPVAMQETKANQVAQEVAVASAEPVEIQNKEASRTKVKVNAEKLLAEANLEIAQTTRKYHIDPKSLLNEAEKENHNHFLQKVFKTVTETSTSVYASVASRNVEP